MDERMRSALAEVLAGYEQRRNRDIAAREAEQASLETFLAGARTTLDTIVAPCFERFAEELSRHHHRCTIEGPKPDSAEKASDVKIELTIFANDSKLPHGNASLSYDASSHRQRVSVHRSVTTRNAGAIPGTIGEYELAQITPALVDQDLLELAQAVFAAT